MNTLTETGAPRRAPWGWVILGLAAWIAAYTSLLPFADGFVNLLGRAAVNRQIGRASCRERV